MSDEILDSAPVQKLTQLVNESIRASKEGVRHFVEPTPGVLAKAKTKRHNIIFGRRGSGKSSLLQKILADLTVDRTPIAMVDLETFKQHSYPDVLLSVLIKSFAEFKNWLDTAATNPASKTSFWKRLFGAVPTRPGFNRSETTALSADFGRMIHDLEQLLHSAEEIKIKDVENQESGSETKGGLAAKSPYLSADASTARSDRQRSETQSEYSSRKVEVLHRNIMAYQKLFDRLSILAGGPSFLLLDDLYHLRLQDQANVLDYFHRIAKGSKLWLKVGTIRHRSRWYVHGHPLKTIYDRGDACAVTKRGAGSALAQGIDSNAASFKQRLRPTAEIPLVRKSLHELLEIASCRQKLIDIVAQLLNIAVDTKKAGLG